MLKLIKEETMLSTLYYLRLIFHINGKKNKNLEILKVIAKAVDIHPFEILSNQ